MNIELLDRLVEKARKHGISFTLSPDGTVSIIAPQKTTSTSAERMARKRERDREKKAAEQTEETRHNASQCVTAPEEVTEIEDAPSSPSPSLSPSPCPLSPPSPTPSSTPLPLIPSPQSQPHPHQPPVFESLDLPLDIETQPPAEKPKQETDETVLALFSIFNRRPRTMMSDKERKAFKLARIQPEDLEAVLEFYGDQHPEWDGKDFRKRDLATLLNNWTSEVDRATSWQAFEKGKHSKKPIFSKTI